MRIDSAVTTYLIYLSALGALGVLSWLCTIWAASTRKPWARWVATALFAAGTSIALFNLLVKDTSGDTGLPPLLGWVGMLPSLAGLLAVILLRRKPPQGAKHKSRRGGHLSWAVSRSTPSISGHIAPPHPSITKGHVS